MKYRLDLQFFFLRNLSQNLLDNHIDLGWIVGQTY